MKYSYTFKQIFEASRKFSKKFSDPFELMRRSAQKLAEVVLEEMEPGADVLFVCGGGIAGRDGFAAAQILYDKKVDVAVFCPERRLSDDCRAMRERFCGEIFEKPIRRRYSLIVDCLFGTEPYTLQGDCMPISFINDSGARVIAYDIPSGLPESGVISGPCVRADVTLTVGGLKHALFLSDGADVSGKIILADLGLELPSGVEIWDNCDVREFFPKRKSNVNKGDFGAACLLAPTLEYTGSAFLAADACLRSGAGYTKLFIPPEVYPFAIGKIPACILKKFIGVSEEILSAQSIALGMGGGINRELYETICKLLEEYSGILILDADALNVLALYGLEPLGNKKCQVILTPHIKEFSRLIGKEVREILNDELILAKEFALKYGLTLVLKSNRTVVTNGTRTAINITGTPALAKGGSGDVLTGFLAGTCARGVRPYEAACVSTYLLGKAGELAAMDLGEYSPHAMDVLERLPDAILAR